ncbi:MarR family winged helix-turn-helix transcriptional regulator [Bifidobacterium choloepi]|uniref:MarR family transcriptional regulator n=1 Tax=Bifidobacterium choloepi TaxID=2614131 RepID=A0A6I5MX94_9BIFI|nr:MarR family transcriptional regulator [Bifidobacterium choloepi]NEG69188.1 MarR family transcriptional regulator [Bifidobacterium choloepi]
MSAANGDVVVPGDVIVPDVAATSDASAMSNASRIPGNADIAAAPDDGDVAGETGRDIEESIVEDLNRIARIAAYRTVREHVKSAAGRQARLFNPMRGQGRVLMALRLGRRVSQRDLALRLGLSRQAVAEVVKKLEAGGFLVREPSAADNRMMLVSLTRKGHEVAATLGTEETTTESMVACLSPDERRTLLGYLERMLATVRKQG